MLNSQNVERTEIRPNVLLPTKPPKKVILTDVDGVLTSWQSNLPYFLKECRLPIPDALLDCIHSEKWIKPNEIFLNSDGSTMSHERAMSLLDEYNESDHIQYLPAYHDAISVINRLKDDYDFIAISALSDTSTAWSNRMYNLNTLFPNAFRELHLSGSMQSKEELFESVIADVGVSNVVCYIDDLSSHLDDYVRAWNVTTNSSPVVFQMNRRLQTPNASNHVIQVSNWNDIEKYL